MSGDAGPIWRNGAFGPDEWTDFRDDQPLPAGGEPLLVPLAAFLASPERFLAHNGALGVRVASGEEVEALEPHLLRLGLIALTFPKFSDGRSYSAARLLRERYRYKGDLRAVGDVLSDQIPLMRRCGFSSFEVLHEPTRAALAAGELAEVRHYYQPIPNGTEVPAGTRPWLRRPVE